MLARNTKVSIGARISDNVGVGQTKGSTNTGIFASFGITLRFGGRLLFGIGR